MRPGVALDQPIDTNQDLRSARSVAQPIDPVTEDIGLLDAHSIL